MGAVESVAQETRSAARTAAFEIRHGGDRQALGLELGGKRFGLLGRVVPERNLADRPLAHMGADQEGRERA